MKNVIDLFRLRFKLLLKGSVLVIPTVFTAVFMGSMYSMAPIAICSSFLLSAVFLYFICIFISMSIHGKDAETAYADYIKGTRSFMEVSEEYKRH